MKSRCHSSISGHSPGHWTHRFAGAASGLLVLLALQGATPNPGTPPGTAEANLIQLGNESIGRSLAEAVTRATTPRSTLDMVKRLSEERRAAHRVIGAEFPLSDFKGIVLADTYDESYIAAVDSICSVYLRTDSTLPSAAAGAYLGDRLSDLPPISSTPAAFATAFVVMRCVQASLQVPDAVPAETRGDIPEVAIRLIREVAQRYRLSKSTFEGNQHSTEIWQASVLERVRCPTHQTPYKLKEERNGLRGDGSFYRRYVVICEGGEELRNLDFDLEALSAISKSGGLQELPARIEKPSSRQPGVEQ